MSNQPRPVFYAVNDCVPEPIRADRWMAQSGGYWMAVVPGESEQDWFEGCDPADFPTPWVRNIDDVPTEGKLIYMLHDFTTIECDATTREVLRRN